MFSSEVNILVTQVCSDGEKKQRLLAGRIDVQTQKSPAGYPFVIAFDQTNRATYVPPGGTLTLEAVDLC